MKYADLHVHTTASDGTVSPSDIARAAKNGGLDAIAVTDHDTMAGVKEAQSAGVAAGLTVVPGIEVSTDYNRMDIHVLGYGVDPDAPGVQEILDRTVEEKKKRNAVIIEKLRQGGFNISPGDVKVERDDTVPGRPQIADALIAKGYVSSVGEAFNKYLERGRPYYADRERIEFWKAVDMIAGAGGMAVLAHPLQYRFSPERLEKLILDGRRAGITGIEVYYSGYSPTETAMLKQYAMKYGMFLTGGSDFHGTRKPDIYLGSIKVPYDAIWEKFSRYLY